MIIDTLNVNGIISTKNDGQAYRKLFSLVNDHLPKDMCPICTCDDKSVKRREDNREYLMTTYGVQWDPNIRF